MCRSFRASPVSRANPHALRRLIDQLLAAQIPVLSWWAVVSVVIRASATLTLLGIFILGAWLHMRNLASIGEVVTFMNFATMLIARLEQVVGFVNELFLQSAKMRRVLRHSGYAPDGRRPAGCERRRAAYGRGGVRTGELFL